MRKPHLHLLYCLRSTTPYAFVGAVLIQPFLSNSALAQPGPTEITGARADEKVVGSYRVAGEEVVLTLDPSLSIIVRLDPKTAESPDRSKDALQRIRSTASSRLNRSIRSLPSGLHRLSGSEQHPSNLEELETTLAELRLDPSVRFAAPVYSYQGRPQIPTGQLLVGLAEGVDADDPGFLNLCRDLALVDTGAIEWARVRKVELDRTSSLSLLEAATALDQSPLIRFAEPELLFSPLRSGFTPNDPLVAQSWHLSNPGNQGYVADADMDVTEAWQLETGSEAIIIAVLDEGVDMDHVDLIANLVEGIDVTDQSANPPEGIAGNAAGNDAHGTACAGIIAAVGNNGSGGVGIAPGCSLMSVRIARSGSGSWTTNAWASTGIELAWRRGADILSNSWGGGTPSSLINTAILNATTHGRGGLGAVLVFAAGNTGLAIEYPANHYQTIAVGATSPCDERKNKTSCDGETWWASNFGPRLDVVAPGVQIRTTDLMGPAGYSAGNYTPSMNGTSAATPCVAGIAGLMLSRNPLLTADQVRQMIRSSADDLVGRPSEDIVGFDNFMGAGRVNAFAAVSQVAPPQSARVDSIEPSSGFLKGGNSLTITGSGFIGKIQVRIDGRTAELVNSDSGSMTVKVPSGNHLGTVTLEVELETGITVVESAYEYVENSVDLTFSGSSRPGDTITLTVSGPAGAMFAIAMDTDEGPYFSHGFEFCFEGPTSPGFTVAKKFRQGIPLNEAGVGSTTFVVPNLPIFSQILIHGATMIGEQIEVTPCSTLTVF